MSIVGFILTEAWSEFRSAVRGPLVPLIFAGLVGYVAIVVLNAEYMQQMGAADVARNSAHVVQLMTVGQAFWLFFAWAWLFGRAVVRDRDARLHELVLAAPVSLPMLFVGRFLGVVGVAVLLGASSAVGFLVVHPLQAVGALPPALVGPPPWGAMLWSWLVFTVSSAVGIGALYLSVALRSRSAAGPFAVAALLMAIWMFAMVILRGGDINPTVATLIDPTGFGEVEAQTNTWTPAEKMTSLVALSPAVVINRVLWCVLPVVPLIVVLIRLRREDLVLDRGGSRRTEDDRPIEQSLSNNPLPGPVESPSWPQALLLEAQWHLRRSLASWGVGIAMGLLCLMCIAGSFVHVVAHAEGPLVPRPGLLVPMLGEFLFITMAFVVAGFVGALMRRDEEVGFYEIVGTVPGPLAVRLGGRALAAVGLTMSMMLVPVVACYVVVGLGAPQTFSWGTPLIYFFLIYAPAMLELCAFALVCHAVFKSSGVAYSLSMFLTFIMVVNHEVSLVTFPLAEVGIPAHVSLSTGLGWAPWLPLVVAQALFKLGLFVFASGLAWLAWSRGYVDHWTARLREGIRRLRGGAGFALSTGLLVMIAVGGLVHQKLVGEGDYQSAEDEAKTRAEWERRWLDSPPSFQVAGGKVEASVDPENRTATARWLLVGVRSSEQRLFGELPSGLEVTEAHVEGQSAEVEVAAESFSLALGACAVDNMGCTVELTLRIERTGWPVEASLPWLVRRQFVLTAGDLLPRLGVDPHRALRSASDRQSHGLPEVPPEVPGQATVSAIGVAPSGAWRWRIEGPKGWSLPHEGKTEGPLDFAVVWRADKPAETVRGDVSAFHGPQHQTTAEQTLKDLEEMRACLSLRLGHEAPAVKTVVQTPRKSLVGVHDSVLLLPEDRSWDVGEGGYGRWHRRRVIAQALAATSLAHRTSTRREPGVRWLLDGVPGWIALSCVRQLDGDAAWLALVHRTTENVVQELGALAAPIRGLSLDGGADWVEPYSGLSTFSWAQVVGEGQAARFVAGVVEHVAAGAPLRTALSQTAGPKTAELLLGPPLSSDAAVVDHGEAAGAAERARRWKWADGGWQSEVPADRLLVLHPYPAKPGGARPPRFLTPPSIVEGAENIILFDVWPSFERSISDNVWFPKL